MKHLSSKDLLRLHTIVEEHFKIFSGVKDEGLLSSIADRPTQQFGSLIPYDNMFKQAASLMEGIIRMHPFYDGNKRTGLLAAICYLEINGFSTIIPFDSVRFTVLIATNQNNDSKSNERLIIKISKWLSKHSSKSNSRMLHLKELLYVKLPVAGLLYLAQYGRMNKYVHSIISDWFAFDIYPEYVQEIKEIVGFIQELLERESVWDLKK